MCNSLPWNNLCANRRDTRDVRDTRQIFIIFFSRTNAPPRARQSKNTSSGTRDALTLLWRHCVRVLFYSPKFLRHCARADSGVRLWVQRFASKSANSRDENIFFTLHNHSRYYSPARLFYFVFRIRL